MGYTHVDALVEVLHNLLTGRVEGVIKHDPYARKVTVCNIYLLYLIE